MIVRSIGQTAKSLSNSMLILSEADTKRCFTVPDAIATTRKALASLVKGGGGEVPKRIGLPYAAASSSSSKSSPDDWSLFKPAAFYPATTDSTNEEILMGMKMVSIRSNNPEKFNKGTVLATTMLLNSETGEVSAIVAATFLTGARTAAGSALATQLAFSNRNTSHGLMLVIFGAGLQAELHIKCIQHVVNITRLVIVNRSIDRAHELKEMILNEQPHLESETRTIITDISIILLSDTEGVENAVKNADIICTTTNACTPLFRGELLKPGCHINGVGSYTPLMQEIDDATVQRSEILIDTKEALEVGDLSSLNTGSDDLNSNVVGLIGDALVGNVKFGTRIDDRIDCTFYKSVGTAIMDVFSAHVAVQNAKSLNIGVDM
jgi:ornithine cyclodeaminase